MERQAFLPVLIGFVYSFLMERSRRGPREAHVGEAFSLPPSFYLDASARFALRYCKHWKLLVARGTSVLTVPFSVARIPVCSFVLIAIRERDRGFCSRFEWKELQIVWWACCWIEISQWETGIHLRKQFMDNERLILLLLWFISVSQQDAMQTWNFHCSNRGSPSCWKTTLVAPVFKSGDRPNIGNYKAMSIVSVIPKIFDEIITGKLSLLLSLLICVEQHGYVKGRSTTTNLTVYSSYVSSCLEHE